MFVDHILFVSHGATAAVENLFLAGTLVAIHSDRSVMEQKKDNQERSRKYGGSSSFVNAGEPSKAPRQDEDGRESLGPSDPDQTPKYNSIGEQGISNRLAEKEHAFPESDEPRTEADGPGSVENTPKQQGGNRGGV